jgi:YhcN/YlaJ family sporulation lipoprotein
LIPTKISRKLFALTLIFILSVLAAGCMNNNGGVQGTQMNQQGNGVRQLGQARQPNNSDDRIQVAEQAANKITGITGVRQANVLITQRNAYVAAVLDNNDGRLTREIEGQIAQQVRAIDPNVRNVYVSTNPDFVGRINTYVNDVQQGRPIAGFVEQFNEMVQRIFPNAR